MTSDQRVDQLIGALPDRPLKIEEVEALERVSWIDRATAVAGSGNGDSAIVVANEEAAIGVVYSDGWYVVDTIEGDCTRDEFVDLMNRTGMEGFGGSL